MNTEKIAGIIGARGRNRWRVRRDSAGATRPACRRSHRRSLRDRGPSRARLGDGSGASALAGTFNAVPAVGTYISAILANIGVLVVGVAVMIILRNIYARLKP